MDIESRTIDGRVFLAAVDVTAALRQRAADFTEAAQQQGEDLDGERYVNATAYHAVAEELRQRSDWIDTAVIAHIST